VSALLGELASRLIEGAPPKRRRHWSGPPTVRQDALIALLGEELPGPLNGLAIAIHVGHRNDRACLLEIAIYRLSGFERLGDRLFDQHALDVFGAGPFQVSMQVRRQEDENRIESFRLQHRKRLGVGPRSKRLRKLLGPTFVAPSDCDDFGAFDFL
jgi:hypothetical protein